MRKLLITVVAFFGALILLLALPLVAASGAAACSGQFDQAAAAAHPTVAGYKGDQLANAATIMSAATALGLDVRAQTVGVMTAMGESGLRNLDYGDDINGVTNPNGIATCSLGIFQQQWCLPGNPWGTKADVQDPLKAATKFFERLKTIPNWETLAPSAAAHAVQINADPNHYTKWLPAAQEVVQTLTDTALAAGTITCTTGDTAPAGDGAGPWGGNENGRIPRSTLQPIPWATQHRLRTDATTALITMNIAFRQAFGYNLPINDAYRDYDEQVQTKAEYGSLAATPGTSNHGWALAIDIGDQSHYVIGFTHPIYAWLKTNAPRYGWTHPAWAEPNGTGPHEAWHWEYTGARP